MKPIAYTQLYLHFVFSPKHREALLSKTIQPEVFRFISGILTQKGNMSIIVNGMPDHIHILTGFNHQLAIIALITDIKRSSALFINARKMTPKKFQWQEGYGAFSYGRSQLDLIYNYIKNQDIHHQGISFRHEYTEFLKKFEVPYNEKYLFDFFD
jgi:putative transposase